jgi:hypothetical protein
VAALGAGSRTSRGRRREAARTLEALELDLAGLAEVDPRADDQLAHEARDEHLASESLGDLAEERVGAILTGCNQPAV